MSERRHSSRGGARIAAGVVLLLAGGLLLVRPSSVWPGDAIVWPAAGALLGALLIWKAPSPQLSRGSGWAAHRRGQPPPGPGRAPATRVRTLVRPEVSRRGLGIALVLAAGFAFLWASGDVRPAGEAVLAAVAVLAAAALIFAPSFRQLAQSLRSERTARIRSQERADVAAHLHDSVLQTLALIQRSSEDPKRVATLARTQERELRGWLAGEDGRRSDERLAGALEDAAAEVEAASGSTIELVTVGDCPLDGAAASVLAAAREAMLNASKFAGEHPVSVYAELSDGPIQVFVRDRGGGFDLAAVPAGRRGVRESILGRMERAGGRALVRSSAKDGTEVELTLERSRS